MLDPHSAAQAAKAAKPLLAEAMARWKLQWKRRGASPLTDLNLGTVDREFDEALDTLTGDAAALPGWLVSRLKAAISARPLEFAETDAREWLRIDDVRRVLKEATLATVTLEPIDSFREAARELYSAATGDADWYGGVLFDYAVAFLSLSLDARVTAEGRLIIAAGNRNTAQITTALADLGADLTSGQDEIKRALDILVSESASDFPADIVSRHILVEVAVEERWRAIDDERRVERVNKLGERVRSGDLVQSNADAKIAVFRLVGAALSRADRSDEADEWIDLAVSLGANEVAADRARIALARSDWSGALALLQERSDRLSVSLMVDALRGRDGEAAALDYIERHVAQESLTGFLLAAVAAWMTHAGRWGDAEKLLGGATEEQLAENPTLLFVLARLRIAMLGPHDQRAGTFENVSSVPRPSTVRDDVEGARLRQAARDDLARLAQLVPESRATEFAVTIDAHILYLDLLSNDALISTAAADRLIEKLSDFTRVLDYAWLAIEFDIPFDETILRTKLERARLLGGWSAAQLVTAFNLTLRDDEDGSLAVSFIEEHRDALVEALGSGLPLGIEIEALGRRGRVADARARLEEWEDRLAPATVHRLQARLEEQEGGNPLAIRLARFEASNEEADLYGLIQALWQANDERVADYSMLMWRRRHRIEDAVAAAGMLFNTGRDKLLDDFLKELGDTVETDPRLQTHAAWAAFRAGDLSEADRRLAVLRPEAPDDAGLRQLAINVAIEGGDWRRLAPLTREDLERKDHRSATQLLQAADIAHAASDPVAEDLTRAAVAKAPEDTKVLMTAFHQALRRGRDWGPEASGWLRRAIELSGDEGPIQSKKIRDLIDLRAEEMKRGGELDAMIMSGEIPLAMAAGPLGTTLSELILYRLADNITIEDGRRRLCLPFVAGNRLNAGLSGATRVGFDPNAILVLHLCGLLEEALSVFPQAIIPAGTLALIFTDLTRADRTQPSRVEQAARIKRMADEGRFSILPSDPVEDDFAALYAAATRLDGFCVHAAPLYVPGSLLEETRDPAPFKERLISPAALVNALAAAGEIGLEEAERGSAALSNLGIWPEEPDVDLDRPLLIDAVVLHALDDAALLEPLLRTGAKLFVEQSTIGYAAREIQQRAHAQELARSIEGVRSTLSAALADGRARIGAFRREADARSRETLAMEREAALAPLISLLQDGSAIDLLVSGDRMINRHGVFTDRAGTNRHVVTIVDVINHLARSGAITGARRAAAMRKLREAGVVMIPVEVDEIVAAAAEGDWRHGAGRALRAICDSIHLPLLRGAPRLPDDRHWLGNVVLAITSAILRCWTEFDTDRATAAADFLFLNLPAVAAWAGRDPEPDAAAWARGVLAGSHALLSLPLNLPTERIDAYHEWYASRVQPRLDGRDAAVIDDVLGRLTLAITAEPELTGGEAVPAEAMARLNRMSLRRIPEVHRERLIQEDAVRAAAGTAPAVIVVDEQEVRIEELVQFLKHAVDGQGAALVAADGAILAEEPASVDGGTVWISRPWGRLIFDFAGLFAGDRATRLSTFGAMLAVRTIAPSSAGRWRALIESGPLPADLLAILTDELTATPESFVAATAAKGADLTLPDLFAVDHRQLAAILDVEEPTTDLTNAVAKIISALKAAPQLAGAAAAIAPLAVSPDFRLDRLLNGKDDAAVACLCSELIDHGDAFSLVAAFEAVCARPQSAEGRAVGDKLVDHLFAEGRLSAVAHDYCIAARISLAISERRHLLDALPLHLRRCTILTHAGHAARALGALEFERPAMLEAANAYSANRYRLANFVERREANEWIRNWLMPDGIEAYLLRRLDRALDWVEEAERPARWLAALESAVGRFNDAGLAILFQVPGPVDEFGEERISRPFCAAEIVTMLADSEPLHALNILYGCIAAVGAPDDPEAMRDAILVLLQRCPDEHWDQAAELALVAAARWKSVALSDAVVEAGLGRPGARGSRIAISAQRAVAAAAAQADAEATEAEVVRRLTDLVFGDLEDGAAATLANFLELLTNVAPGWGTSLERLRSSALLAA